MRPLFFWLFGGVNVNHELKTTTVPIGLRVPVHVRTQLRELARLENNGVSAVCRRILTDALEREVQRHAGQLGVGDHG